MSTSLEVQGVHLHFRGNHALRGVSLTLDEPAVCGLIGPNGAGKSSLANVLAGVYRPSGGAVFLDGRRCDGLPPYEIARRGLGRTFQIPRPFERMTVRENLLVPGYASRRWASGRLRDRIDETLGLLGLEHLAGEQARALSGGQRKLLELARLMLLDPGLLILDEPLAGVHPRLRQRILALIAQLRSDGKIVVVIEHDMEAIFAIAERVLVLAAGQLIADGPPEAVRRDPGVIEAYLGPDQGAPAARAVLPEADNARG